jgi:hypothetical protein
MSPPAKEAFVMSLSDAPKQRIVVKFHFRFPAVSGNARVGT